MCSLKRDEDIVVQGQETIERRRADHCGFRPGMIRVTKSQMSHQGDPGSPESCSTYAPTLKHCRDNWPLSSKSSQDTFSFLRNVTPHFWALPAQIHCSYPTHLWPAILNIQCLNVSHFLSPGASFFSDKSSTLMVLSRLIRQPRCSP